MLYMRVARGYTRVGEPGMMAGEVLLVCGTGLPGVVWTQAEWEVHQCEYEEMVLGKGPGLLWYAHPSFDCSKRQVDRAGGNGQHGHQALPLARLGIGIGTIYHWHWHWFSQCRGEWESPSTSEAPHPDRVLGQTSKD